MITADTRPPTNAERLARYYAALPGSPDFHPHQHAARAARGLRIIARRSVPGGVAGPFLLPSPSNLRRPGCTPPALLPDAFCDVTCDGEPDLPGSSASPRIAEYPHD
jgi:hypothetical protein